MWLWRSCAARFIAAPALAVRRDHPALASVAMNDLDDVVIRSAGKVARRIVGRSLPIAEGARDAIDDDVEAFVGGRAWLPISPIRIEIQ